MDTFLCGQNCDIWQFYGHFFQPNKTAIYGSFMDTFRYLRPKPTKLRTLAVLWTLFGCLSPSSCMVPQNCHIWQFYGHFTKLPYMAVVPKWLRDKIKRFQSSSFRNIYEMNPFFFQLINRFCQRLDYLVTILKIEADLDNTQTMNSLKKILRMTSSWKVL